MEKSGANGIIDSKYEMIDGTVTTFLFLSERKIFFVSQFSVRLRFSDLETDLFSSLLLSLFRSIDKSHILKAKNIYNGRFHTQSQEFGFDFRTRFSASKFTVMKVAQKK